jgi:hypothetical protein
MFNKFSLNLFHSKFGVDSENEKYKLMIPLITSPLAEAIAVLFYLPFDTVRIRMQANDPKYNYTGVINAITEIKKTEGVLRLFKAAPLYVSSFTTYVGF